MDIEPPKKKSSSCLKTVGIVIAFIALFVIGVNLSSSIRQFLPSGLGGQTETQTTSNQPSVTPSPSASPAAQWKTYTVVSGITKVAIPGITFQLPPDILPPICDGVGCASAGTYLPGGTRFTVAPRGSGQSLRDFRGSIITDVTGTAFTTKPAVVNGHSVIDFSGVFTGRTVSGYAFSTMHGVMIEANNTVSLEVNHFTPNGVTADFEKDDLLFNEILKTFTFTSITPTVLPVASTSGY